MSGEIRQLSQVGSFLLQSSALFLAIVAAANLGRDPRRRFHLHLCFLLLASGFWSFLVLADVLAGSASAPASTHLSAASPVLSVAVPRHDALGPLLAWLGWGYVAITAALFLVDLLRHLRLHLRIEAAAEPPRALREVLDRVVGELSMPRYRVVLMEELSSPGVVGLIRPCIALPTACAEWDAEVLADVLRHELIHIRRHDYLWSRVADVAAHLLFFHPAVWYSRRQLQVNRELACDRSVVGLHPERVSDYAGLLTRFARLQMLRNFSAPSVDLARPASLLSQRVEALLFSQPEKRSLLTRSARVLVSFAIVAGTALCVPSLRLALIEAPVQAAIATPVPSNRVVSHHTRRAPHATAGRNNVSMIVYDESQTPTRPARGTQTYAAAPLTLDSTGSPDEADNNGDQRTVWTGGPPVANTSARPSVTRTISTGIAAIGGILRGDRDVKGRPDHN